MQVQLLLGTQFTKLINFMKTKIIISSLVLLITVAVASFIYLSLPIKWDTPPATIQDVKINDNTNPFVIKIIYPYIASLDSFNKRVKDITDKEISDFKTNSLANDAEVKKVDPVAYANYPQAREYELDIGYDKGEIDNNIISVMFNVYNFEGGAHGASYFVPLNYNVKTKQEIKLSDLFPNQPDYLQKISDFCTADLTKQLTKSLGNLDGTYLKDGAGPVADNFQYFLINPNNTITFYFPQYQVAYGAAGDFKVTMPR